MSGFTYLINLSTVNGGAFGRLSSDASRFESSLERVNRDVNQTGNSLSDMGNRGRSAFGGMNSSLSSLIARLGLAALTINSLNTAVDMSSLDSAISFAGGALGAKNLQMVKDSIAELKLPMRESLEGFKTLSGGLIGTGIEGEAQVKIFRAVGKASLVMGLNAEQTSGAMLALSQMASKGKVSAEELRGQLGERLPGAFGIAARAMGMTTMELDAALQKGNVMSNEFLPRFAEELEKTFGAGVQNAVNGPRAAFNEFNNSLLSLKQTIGQELLPTATALIKDFFVPAFQWIGKNIDVIGMAASVLGSLYVATKVYLGFTAFASMVTGGFSGAVWGLNAAMLANPITWIVGLVVGLGAAVVYAWNKFEGFRAFIFGIWEVIKEFGAIIYDNSIRPLMALGKTLIGVFTFDKDMISSGIQETADALSKISLNVGERVGNAFTNGWNKGVQDFGGGVAAQNLTSASPGAAGALGGAFSGAPIGGASGAPSAGTKTGQYMATGISGGGQRNVTVNVNKLIEAFTVNTTNVKEGVEQLGELVQRKILEVLNSANQINPQNG